MPARSASATALTFCAGVGVLTGILDGLFVWSDLFYARRGIQFLPFSLWPAAVLFWTGLCVLAGLPLAAFRKTANWAVVAATAAGPWLLLVLRFRPLLRNLALKHWHVSYGLSSVLFLVGCIALLSTVMLCIYAAPGVRRILRALPVPLAALLAVATIVVGVSRLPIRSAPSRPAFDRGRNVVLIFLDTLRYDWSGLAPGTAGRAPNLARYGNQAVLFESAITPSSWTLPATLSVLTGLSVPSLGVDFDQQRMRGGVSTLAERLRARGYTTHAVFANWVMNPGTGVGRGFERLEYPLGNLDFGRTAVLSYLRERNPAWAARLFYWPAAETTRRAIRAIPRDGRSWFLAVNYLDPHDPYVPSPECPPGPALSRKDFERAEAITSEGAAVEPQMRARFLAAYAAAIHCLDASLGELIERLEPSVRAGQTVVAIVSDHGEQFGENRFFYHGNSLYRHVIHVPMLVRAGHLRPQRIARPVSITDLNHFLLRASHPETGEGELLQAFREVPPVSVHHPPQGAPGRLQRPLWSVVDERLHLIMDDRGEALLFDRLSDSGEERNLLGRPDLRDPQQRLSRVVRALQLRMRPDQDPRQRFRGLGYFE